MPVLLNGPAHDSLEVQVTEPAIFLRAYERRCRRHDAPTDEGEPSSGALIRGVLTLTLANAVQISSIDVELEGRAATTWVEGAGAGHGRIERSEKYTVYSASTVLFMVPPGTLSGNSDGRRGSSVTPPSRDDHHPGWGGWVRHSTNDNDGQSTLSSHDRIKDFPTNMLSSRTRSTSVDPPGRYRVWRNGYRSDYHFQDNSLDTRGRHPQNQEPAPSYAFTDPRTTSEGGSVASLAVSGTDSLSNPESESEVQRDLTARLDLTAAIHQTQVSSPVNLPEINEENPPEESYVSTATSRSRSPEHRAPIDSDHDRRGRSPPGLSFTAVAHVFGAIKERTARSLSPLSHRGLSLSRSMLTDRSERGRPPSTAKERSRTVASADASQVTTDSPSCGTILESDSESRVVTFQRGTYNYPFYFTLPRNVPPTTKTEHGSFIWRLNATVKQNSGRSWQTLILAACKEVEVVYSPIDDEIGEISETSNDVQLQRIWDAQFEYKFSIPRNSFPLDETLPIQLEILPLTRIKIYRIAVYLDERVGYFARSSVRVRTETITRATLLQLQQSPHSYETNEPILPLTSSNVQTFRASPFHRLRQLNQDAEREEALCYAGPGPWSVKCELRLPGAMQGFHASTPKVNSEGGTEWSLKSNVRIDHLLKVLIRIEKGDEGVVTGKKHLYDVLMHVPIRMLSSLCTAEWTALPRYSSPSLRSVESNPSSSHNRSSGRSPDRLSDRLNQRSNRGRESRSPPFLPHSVPAETRSPARMEGGSGYGELYERLVSGLESETGQAPPRYGECELQTRT